MAVSDAFQAFEHAGWDKDSVALAYHRNFGEVTREGVFPISSMLLFEGRR